MNTAKTYHPFGSRQMNLIWEYMCRGGWRTIQEIASGTSQPPTSVQATLCHFRKEKFGSHTVLKRYRGRGSSPKFEYMLVPARNEG